MFVSSVIMPVVNFFITSCSWCSWCWCVMLLPGVVNEDTRLNEMLHVHSQLERQNDWVQYCRFSLEFNFSPSARCIENRLIPLSALTLLEFIRQQITMKKFQRTRHHNFLQYNVTLKLETYTNKQKMTHGINVKNFKY